MRRQVQYVFTIRDHAQATAWTDLEEFLDERGIDHSRAASEGLVDRAVLNDAEKLICGDGAIVLPGEKAGGYRIVRAKAVDWVDVNFRDAE
jgi:hypothetical protein